MLHERTRKYLEAILKTATPSGFEQEGQRRWMEFVRPWADEVQTDAYGNAWAIRQGSSSEGPCLLIEAHIDEIGLMVRYIDEQGFLWVSRIGGSDRALARSRRVYVLTEQGPVPGIVGHTAIHLRESREESIPKWQEVYIDVGATSREEVAQKGIRVGHPIVYADEPWFWGEELIIGRAVDNRIGGAVLGELLRRLAEAPQRPAATVIAASAVQEEVGGNGARMIGYRLRPDVAVVIDVTHATDTPGIDRKQHGDVRLGKGPTLSHGAVNHPAVVRRLLEAAERAGVPIQHEALSLTTGTDTDDIFDQRGGIPSALLSIPMRYMHSTVETVHVADVEGAVRVLESFIQALAPGERFSVL
nr:MAG: endoglucanase [Bacteroidota bacterium]